VRPGPSRRFAGPCAPSASRLGLLTYRAVHRHAADHRATSNAVLSRRRGRHRPDRTGHGRCHDSVPARRVEPGRGGRRGARGRRRRGRRHPRTGESSDGDSRGTRRRRATGPVGLGKSVSALRAEQCAVGGHLSAMQANRHGRGQG
jgi:hypothetical protein